jgi:hypothetical protein
MCVILVFVSEYGCDIHDNVTTGAVSTFRNIVYMSVPHTIHNFQISNCVISNQFYKNFFEKCVKCKNMGPYFSLI